MFILRTYLQFFLFISPNIRKVCFNFIDIISDDTVVLKFAGRTVATKSLVLVSIKYQCDEPTHAEIIVNCEKMVVGGLLLKDLKEIIAE